MRRGATGPDAIVRAVLVLAILGGVGLGGWSLAGGGVAGGALAALCVLAAAIVWLGLATPGDPGGWGHGWIAVSGPIRLLIEAIVIGIAATAIWLVISRAASETLLTAVGVVYLITWDRIAWLLRSDSGRG